MHRSKATHIRSPRRRGPAAAAKTIAAAREGKMKAARFVLRKTDSVGQDRS